MSKPVITTESRVCKNPKCRKEYVAEVVHLLGVRIVRGSGYCPDCVQLIPKVPEEVKETTPERIARGRREMRESSGIPPKFMAEDFSTFEQDSQPKAFKKCLEFAESFPLVEPQGKQSLVLYSEHSWGVGKTHLACAIGHRILDRWKGERIGRRLVLFVSEPDLYVRIQSTYGSFSRDERPNHENESDIIRQLTGASLLIIDDVGKRRVQDLRFVQRIMFSIIDGRYKAMLPLVLTANLSPDGLKSYLGGGEDEASFDRLTEMCGGRSGKGVKFFQLEGPSYRRK